MNVFANLASNKNEFKRLDDLRRDDQFPHQPRTGFDWTCAFDLGFNIKVIYTLERRFLLV